MSDSLNSRSAPAVLELQELWSRLNGPGLHDMSDQQDAWFEIWGCQDDGREGKYPKNACAYCLVRNALSSLGVAVKYPGREGEERR